VYALNGYVNALEKLESFKKEEQEMKQHDKEILDRYNPLLNRT
jgi:hypothetical protein